MQRFPRLRRILGRRPRPASLLAAGTAVIILGGLGAIGATDTVPAAAPKPSPGPAVTSQVDDIVQAYNAGWKAGVRALGSGSKPTPPAASGDASNAGTVAWADGWVDGQADALGDDNRDGKVTISESGWGKPVACRGEVEYADLCATVAARPAYAWTDEDGTPHSVDSGRELLARVTARPGSEAFAAVLFALDTQWAQHNEQ